MKRAALSKAVTSRGLSELVGRLSPKRQETIRPVLENPHDFVLMNVRDLAKRLNSDPATTIRIVLAMGFPSYREFQKYLHQRAIAQATSVNLMESSAVRDPSIPAFVREAIDQEAHNLQALRSGLDFRRLEQLARRVWTAKRIMVLGGDLASSLVIYFEYQLTMLGLTVLIATTPGRSTHLARTCRRGDLVFAISFRKGLRLTVEGMQEAKAHGAYCVGITDTFVSPVARLANECFLASVQTTSFGASYSAPMALLNLILVACANYRRPRTLVLLRQAEKEQRVGFRWYET